MLKYLQQGLAQMLAWVTAVGGPPDPSASAGPTARRARVTDLIVSRSGIFQGLC
jgi:hypothetical protein